MEHTNGHPGKIIHSGQPTNAESPLRGSFVTPAGKWNFRGYANNSWHGAEAEAR